MPLVKVEILKGSSKEYKKGILEGIHVALVEAFKIPDDDRIHRIYELSKENFEFDTYKSERFVLIEITIFEGRSLEAKKTLYKSIVRNLNERLGIPDNDILITLQEVPLDNWGIRGKSASEVDLGFKINV